MSAALVRNTDGPLYDQIIIGGGSAGCVLANRLSADPNCRVLVLEAGRPDYRFDFRLHMPAALTYPLASKAYNWWYDSAPEPALDGRRVYQPRGKVLGGSSAINGMIFIRGNPLDFEKWAELPSPLGGWTGSGKTGHAKMTNFLWYNFAEILSVDAPISQDSTCKLSAQ